MTLFRAAALIVALACAGPAAATNFAARVEAAAMLDEMDMRAQYDQLVVVALDNQIKMNPNLAPYRAVMANFFNKYMSYDALKPDLIAIYENNYSTEELHELRKFFATPAGKKMVRLTPQIAKQSAELSNKRLTEHLAELQQAIKDEADRIEKQKNSIVVPSP